MPRVTGVRALRERLAIEQRELAQRAGLHRVTLSRAERGYSVGVGVVTKLAAALQVPAHQIVSPAKEARLGLDAPPAAPRPPAACPRVLAIRAAVGAVHELLHACEPGTRV